jgi:glutaminase
VLGAPAAWAQTAAQIDSALKEAHARYLTLEEGKVADYIPALAKVDPKIFGIAVVTTDGKVHTVGDVTSVVSIQSISKVFTMARVIQDSGPDAILNSMGADANGLRPKSGVGGGIIAVAPGRFGIAAISPPLDSAGNSVRAQRAIADVSSVLGGNPYAARPDVAKRK